MVKSWKTWDGQESLCGGDFKLTCKDEKEPVMRSTGSKVFEAEAAGGAEIVY